MTRNYEVVYIFDPALDQDQINEKLERFHGLLQSDGAPEPIRETNHWGKRTLAYPIQGKETGYYVVVEFETEPGQLTEFERILKLDDNVMRYLVVLREKPVEEPESARTDESDESDDRHDSDEHEHRSLRVFDYKDERALQRFTTETGKIQPRRMSNVTARQQRQLSQAIKRARFLALLPYVRQYGR